MGFLEASGEVYGSLQETYLYRSKVEFAVYMHSIGHMLLNKLYYV